MFLLSILSVWFVWLNKTNQMNNTNQMNQINPSRSSRAATPDRLLVGASVFEGEFRDGGLVQLAFAECDQSQVLIVGRLS